MDLLETILRSCNAEKYVDSFKNNNISPFALKILSHEDLEMLGITDEEMQKAILKHAANLQIPSEKKQNCTVDEQYILLVFSQISLHLHKHYANLCYAVKRDDVDLCPIEISHALYCLEDCLDSFDDKLVEFENKSMKRIKRKTINILIPTIATTGALLFLTLLYSKYAIK